MVDTKIVHKQLKKLKFGGSPLNQAELRELPSILHENEKILECVNGFYEGGIALLVATDSRLLLVDKKPLNYLNVEDLRFDMINEIDYSHRLMGATITISTGSKALKFKSYNQARLRNLIGLVQERMTKNKKEQSAKADNQQQHLEEINKQLQMYLLAQHQQLQQQVSTAQASNEQLLKPNPQLSDYLFAQRLLEQFQRNNGPIDQSQSTQSSAVMPVMPAPQPAAPAAASAAASTATPEPPVQQVSEQELLADAKREVFGKTAPAKQTAEPEQPLSKGFIVPATPLTGIEINPMRIAYSKLPMMLRNRKFGRPSFHAHSQQATAPSAQPQPVTPNV